MQTTFNKLLRTVKLWIVLASVPLLVFIHSCKKFIEAEPSPVQVETAVLFADDASANSAVLGLYSQAIFSPLFLMNGGLSVYAGLSADEHYNTAANANVDPFTSNTLLSNNSIVNANFWSASYRVIYHANAIIEGIDASVSLTPAAENQLRGEVLVVRALFYFYLVNLFGDVPLITTTNYIVNAVMPRTPATQVYQQIISDLEEAKALLSNSYPTTGRFRPNSFTATALLARVYLYEQKWAQAEMAASSVIQSGLYQLTTDLNTTFLPVSSEAIWLIIRENSNTTEAATFIPASTTVKPAYAITNKLLSAFEATDKRKNSWLKAIVVSGQSWYHPYKYKVRTSTPHSENVVVFRLAEQFLIRAEARAQLGKIDSALADLNRIRNRAGLVSFTATTKEALLLAIEKERQTELFCEWGHRWFDLKRTGRIDAVLAAIKPQWHSTAALYPLPFAELDRNAFLVQNPGY